MVDEGSYSDAFLLHDISENCKISSKKAHEITQNIDQKCVRKLTKNISPKKSNNSK